VPSRPSMALYHPRSDAPDVDPAGDSAMQVGDVAGVDRSVTVGDGTALRDADSPGRALELVSSLCRALQDAGIRYCHWKSNESLDRSASGENDLDLLVLRSDASRFEGLLRDFGFRDARLPRWKELPGVYHSYAVDRVSGHFVHIHAHYQLVIGDDMTKNYHLPIEVAYLASARPVSPFMVPAPEFELALFLIRMVIKHCTWDAFLTLQSSLSKSERRELDDLVARVDLMDVWDLLGQHIPFVRPELWQRCLRAVKPGASVSSRIRTASTLQAELAVWARRPRAVDTSLRMWRRFRTLARRKVFRRGPVAHRLAGGGVLIGIVGGDGAGKTTALEGLTRWLATENFFAVTVHMGKPAWSVLSAAVKGSMKVAASVKRRPTSSASSLRSTLATEGGTMDVRDRARLVWEVLTARDRSRTYRRARRLASNGEIVICDRYPLPQVSGMDGPVTARAKDPARLRGLAKSLAARENTYYQRIRYPDILIVLRVHPDLAVQRKAGVEPESTVRPRSEEIWQVDWADTPAIVVDAAASREEVLSEIKSLIWSRL
jgi:thymidylate kinase